MARALSGVKPDGSGYENGGLGDSRFLRVHEKMDVDLFLSV